MYKIIFTLILVGFPFTLFAQSGVAPLRARKYIPLKNEFRQLRISPLPKKNGQIDAKTIIINSSLFNKNEVQYLNRTQRSSLKDVAKAISENKLREADIKWKAFIAELAGGAVPIDINALIQFILRESYLEKQEDLKFYAAKVKYYNELKKMIREMIYELRDQLASDIPRALEIQLEKMIEDLEDDLQSAGDDAQLANIDLQNKLQKLARTLQTISSVSKMLHDTAMASIRNIR
jgi:hypothetical protein